MILLVEYNPDDEALTLRALKKNNIQNEVVVAHDGVEAVDFFFGTGLYAGRDLSVVPEVVLLDLKLPKIDGLEVLRHLRADERTRLLPIVILTSSMEDQDRLSGYGLGTNSYIRKPVGLGRVRGSRSAARSLLVNPERAAAAPPRVKAEMDRDRPLRFNGYERTFDCVDTPSGMGSVVAPSAGARGAIEHP